MITLSHDVRIWLCAGHTDMRKGFDGLSAIAQHILQKDPFNGHVFVFRGKRGDRVKLLWWDGQGLCLYYKRLEHGRLCGRAQHPVLFTYHKLNYQCY